MSGNEVTAVSFLARAAWQTALACLVILCFGSDGFSEPATPGQIAILKTADITPYNQAVAGFKDALPASTTYVEYDLQGDLELGRYMARETRDSDPALILAVGLKAALAAKMEIHRTPVIYCMVLDPMKHSLTAPNMTGILLEVSVERQFAIIDAVLPALRRIGVIYNPANSESLIREARRHALRYEWKLLERRVETEQDVPSGVRDLLPKVDALWLVPDSTVLNQDSFRFLLGKALDHNVPVIGFSSEFVRSGALVSVSASYSDMGKQAGMVAGQILNGLGSALERLIPPDRVSLALNLKTAQFLGITIPPYVVSTANELY